MPSLIGRSKTDSRRLIGAPKRKPVLRGAPKKTVRPNYRKTA